MAYRCAADMATQILGLLAAALRWQAMSSHVAPSSHGRRMVGTPQNQGAALSMAEVQL